MEFLLLYYLLWLMKRRARTQLRQSKHRRQAVHRRLQFRHHQSLRRSNFAQALSVHNTVPKFIRRERMIWVKERSSRWWDEIATNFTQEEWLSNFRVSKATFNYLCDELRPLLYRVDTVMRKALAVEKRVAITLWFLATGGDYRTIGHLFGVAKSTVCVVAKEVCESIVTVLRPKYIEIPSGGALKKVVEGFRRDYNFPQCAGSEQ